MTTGGEEASSARSATLCEQLLDTPRYADIIKEMRSRRMSIFVCAMTLLCPVWCMAELSAHCDAHEADVAGATAAPCGDGGHRPHHEHDGSGNPDPHGEHTCLCTGGTPPGSALQIPAMQPAAIIAADDVSLANLDATFLLVLINAHGPTDTSCRLHCAPLLI